MGFEFDIAVLVVFSVISFVIFYLYDIDFEAWYTFLTNLGVFITLAGAWAALDIGRAITILENAVIGQVIGTIAGLISMPIKEMIEDLLFTGIRW